MQMHSLSNCGKFGKRKFTNINIKACSKWPEKLTVQLMGICKTKTTNWQSFLKWHCEWQKVHFKLYDHQRSTRYKKFGHLCVEIIYPHPAACLVSKLKTIISCWAVWHFFYKIQTTSSTWVMVSISSTLRHLDEVKICRWVYLSNWYQHIPIQNQHFTYHILAIL